MMVNYFIYLNYSGGYDRANSVDPDQTLHAASDQDLHCLRLISQILDILTGRQNDVFSVFLFFF